MLLPLTHTSSRLDYTQQGLKIIKGCTQENSEVRTPSALTWVCPSHTSLTAGLMLTCKFIFSAKRNRTFFFFLFSLKLNPLVAFNNQWTGELMYFLKRSEFLTNAASLFTALAEETDRRPQALPMWRRQTRCWGLVPGHPDSGLKCTGSVAMLHSFCLCRVQPWTGAHSKQLCHCSVFKKGQFSTKQKKDENLPLVYVICQFMQFHRLKRL